MSRCSVGCGRRAFLRHLSDLNSNTRRSKLRSAKPTSVKTLRRGKLPYAIGSHEDKSGEDLARVRRLKRGGIQLSAAVLTAALAGGMLSGSLPGIPARAIPPAVGVMGAGLVMYVGALFFQNEGQLHCVWHSSQLHFELGVPPCWVNSSMVPQLPDAAIAVKRADEVRGYGAFVTREIRSGTFVGKYEGDLLDLATYYDRYRDGMSDYCITIDDEWVIDGSSRADDREKFSPCHINHSRTRFNVARRTLPAQKRVEFYLITDVGPGDELLLNYGSNYWTNRQHLELP